jgi:hypothetical protein
VSLLALLLVLLISLFAVGSTSEEGSESQRCAAPVGETARCGPTIVDGTYQVPASGTVVAARVNNGSLPPEYQKGYEVTIDATGRATVVVTPVGASRYLGDARTAEPVTTIVELGVDGLQALLGKLDAVGFFLLPTREDLSPEDVPVGGSTSNLDVTLADGEWDIEGAGLKGDDRAALDEAQRILAKAVGLDPDDPTGGVGATPVAG